MRKLGEIIDSARDGDMPSHEECYWSMLALHFLLHMSGKDLRKVAFPKNAHAIYTPKFQAEEGFQRNKRAMDADPKKYVGWNNDPANPEYQRHRKIALKIAEKVIAGMPKEGD